MLPACLFVLMAPQALSSPSGRIRATCEVGPRAVWIASLDGKTMIQGNFGLILKGDGDLLASAELIGTKQRSVRRATRLPHGKASSALESFGEKRFELKSRSGRRLDVVFRCYDDAVAFRYEMPRQRGLDKVVVSDETTSFRLAGDPRGYLQHLESFQTSHEHNVSVAPFSATKTDTLLDLPAAFYWPDGRSAAITEASLRKYAGMSLMRAKGSDELQCRLSPRADGDKVVTGLPFRSPWRVALMGDRPGALLESNMILLLNEPSEIGGTNWIKPGKMTWHWWNGNLTDDPAGERILSVQAQKRYIDFCAESGIAFHATIADETDTPWYVQPNRGLFPGPGTDATRPRYDLDLAAIRSYARRKGVRLWTWVHQLALRDKVEETFAAFAKLGWSGMMVDFFDRDDQETVERAERILQAAAKHRILIHFHGIFKPTGLQRTYPNLMNHEGALNLEYLKWGMACTPEHDLNMAFTRLIAGPMDYHLGGFRAVRPTAFVARNAAPFVLGTRARMLGMYVCFDNPNPMVADSPSAYRGELGFEFIKEVPTWWDETRVLMAEPGRLLVTARRKGKDWWIGGLSAGPSRNIEIPLQTFGAESFDLLLWSDAPNADEDPNLLSTRRMKLANATLKVRLAVDGGFAARIEPMPPR